MSIAGGLCAIMLCGETSETICRAEYIAILQNGS